MRSSIVGLIILGLLGLSRAQEEKVSKPKENEVLSAEVSTGYVIAYGRYIKPPYKITLKAKSDTTDIYTFYAIYVNGLQAISPMHLHKETPLSKEFYRRKRIFTYNCQEKYYEWAQTYGVEEALKRLDKYVRTQNLVKIKEFELKKGGIWVTCDFMVKDLYFIEDTTRHIMLSSNPERARNFLEWHEADTRLCKEGIELPTGESFWPKSKRDRVDLYHAKVSFSNLVDSLRNNQGFSVDTYGSGYLPSNSQLVLNKIREILKQEIPDSLKKEQILNALPSFSEEWIREILYEQNSWKEKEKDKRD